MILLTTSDYFPKLGGLSTFTKNIEMVLRELGLEYKLFHWKNYKEIENFSVEELSKYSLIINIHPQFSWLSQGSQEKMINFIHGSEVLMTSPSFLKKLYKKINKKIYFNKLEKCNLNIFISEYTLEKAGETGLTVDYSRDIILHNCIDVSDASYIKNVIKHKIIFSCIVRNVAHKNLTGSVQFCEFVSKVTGKEVELIVPKGSGVHSTVIKINELSDSSDSERDNAYKEAHYNLLLSKDHSKSGFVEGFGLTVLEAARFGTPSIVMNTGGLPEAVHHGETGWVIQSVTQETVEEIFSKENESKYYEISFGCFGHTMKSHTLKEYKNLLALITSQRGVA